MREFSFFWKYNAPRDCPLQAFLSVLSAGKLDSPAGNVKALEMGLWSCQILRPRLIISVSFPGRELWVMVVSSSPFQHIKGKPDVKYVANIHGNEAVPREMALHLIEVRQM